MHQLTALANSPELVTDEERRALIGCLEDDTMLRLFLTPVLTATGPLSAESSACLRSGFADTDVGALMLDTTGEPGANPDAEATMAVVMVSFMVSLSCLNEAVFQTASPTMGIAPEEYENSQCVLQEVGGPERWGNSCIRTLAFLTHCLKRRSIARCNYQALLPASFTTLVAK